MKTSHRLLLSAAIVAGVFPATTTAAQDVLARVRTLYESAAYEEALAAMPGAAATPEIEIYRVSCLVALGRTDEAAKAVDEIVLSHPSYRPDGSPRIQELFASSRRRLLPQIARHQYADAKAALDRKDRSAAVKGFSDVVALLDDPEAPQGDLSELRLVASGFLDLSRALPEAAAPTPAPPSEAARPSEQPKAPAPVVETAAEPIQQKLPAWQPRDPSARHFQFHGTLKIGISAQGKVESAEIVRPVEYSYDPLLLRAAREWLYRPATRNGVPVASEKIVEVSLNPR